MHALLSIDERLAPAFLHLTYPSFRQALLAAGRDPSIIAFGTQEEGEPTGLVLAHQNGESLQVLSLYTVEPYRNRGIASSLLASLELVASRTGAHRMELTYMSGRAGEIPLNRILNKQQWSPPQPRMLVLRAHTRPLPEAPRWIRTVVAPSGMSTFPWKELDGKTEQRLRENHAKEPWVTPELDPFTSYPGDPPSDPDTSLGLLYKGEVVGWMITHRIATDTIRYSQWCIRPDLRRGAAAPFLLAVAIRRQILRTNATKLQLGVKADNRTMLRFLDRHLEGCFVDSYYSMGRTKELH